MLGGKKHMTKKLLVIAAAFMFGPCLAVSAQFPGADNGTVPKRIEADGTTVRSMELERIKRAGDKGNLQPTEAYRRFNFDEIKKDFEQMQLVFDSRVVRVYRSTDPIDYPRISDGAEEIGQRASRLKANLFAEKTKKEKIDTIQGGPNRRQEIVKKLIVNLNDSIKSLVTNPIFRNPGVIDPRDSERAKTDLDRIILLSSQLSLAGDRQN
jgi:hypothetical protein